MLQTATLGGGCFWCTEAIFQNINGVKNVTSGYSGGNVPGHPTYREICSGLTGHAEVVQITFNAKIISYSQIVYVFMSTHNPTTVNQQGADKGTQYRSVIYYRNKQQKNIAERVLNKMDFNFKNPIVTQIKPFKMFYKAENFHQNYYNNNKDENYCKIVILPKLEHLSLCLEDKIRYSNV